MNFRVLLLALDKVVVDANIFVSALLKDSTTRRMLLNTHSNLFAPDFLMKELLKYAPEFARRLGVRESEVVSSIESLFLLSEITLVPHLEYCGYMKAAVEASPDINDVPYFALAMKLNSAIWSQDSRLKKQPKVMVFNTAEILKLGLL